MAYLVNKFSILFVFTVVCFLTILFFVSTTKYINLKLNWDEVDYANSVSKGFINNYLDIDSLSFNKFFDIGLSKYKNKEIKIDQSKYISEKNDNFNLRHFHPPLPVYYWSIFNNNNKNTEENSKRLRISQVIFFSIVILIFTSITYYNAQNISNIIISLLFLFFIITNNTYFDNFFNLHFHSFFSLILFYHVYSTTKYFNQLQNNFYKYNFIISISLMIITLETFPIVLLSTFLLFYLIKKTNLSKKDLYELSKNFLIAILLVIFIFPSSILKFTYVKIYAMYFYRIFKKNNQEYDKLNYFENWKNIFSDNILFFSIIFFIIIFFIFTKNKLKEIYIYLFYIIIYSVAITPFILSSTYIFPSLFLMISMTLLFLNKINLKLINFSYLLLFIILGIIGNFYFTSITNYKNDFKNYNEKIEYLISNHLNNFIDENIIIDGAHIINYYSLNSSYQNLNIFSIQNPDFYIRKDYQNLIITDKIKNKEFNKIIFQSNRNFQLDKINFLTINNYKLIDDKNGYKVYKLFNE